MTSTPYPLPTIPYLRLRVTLRALARARLPEYKGSMLRGAFGHALRRAVCAMGPAESCPSCRLRRACVYTRLFETLIEDEPPPFLRGGMPTSPRPYVLEPAGDARDFVPGDRLDFDLLLFGQAAELSGYALLAVERMASAGLGASRFPFALDRVAVAGPGGEWRPVFEGGRPAARCDLTPAGPPLALADASRAVLRFHTPTRIHSRGRLIASPTFRGLAFAMLRRTLEIAHFHVPGAAIDWSFRHLLERADRVRIVADGLQWRDWDRYSNRQGTKMTLGGFVGTMAIEGDLTPFAPLLRTAEVLHVGKGATFGLGRMAVEAG